MASETRKIEKYGVLKLLPEDRGANNILVIADVIQLPFSEYVNTKSNPNKGHYGYCCLMYGEYVKQIIDIQFRRQVLVDFNQYVVQLAYQEFHNSKTILEELANFVFDTVVSYPIWNCTELRFKLEPGVVLQVTKSSIPMVLSQPDGIEQDDLIPPTPPIPGEPPEPPPEDAPNEDKIPLSPPYDGGNDSGNTYLRPEPEPEQPTEAIPYQVTGNARALQFQAGNEQEVTATFSAVLVGPITVEAHVNQPNPYGSQDSFVNLRGPNANVNNALPIERHLPGTYTYTFTFSPI